MSEETETGKKPAQPTGPGPKPVYHLDPSAGSSSVELEPLSLHPESPRYVPSHATAPGAGGDYGQAVPDKPRHVCPECDYILTGLTSRRCPECGTPFTLSRARQRAIELTPRGKEDTRAIRTEQITLYVGIGLLVLSTFGPFFAFRGTAPIGGFWLVSVNGTIVVIACMMKGYFDLRWGSAILVAGIITALLALVMIIL